MPPDAPLVASKPSVCVNVCVHRLVRQVPVAMSEVCVQWSTLVYPLLLHLNPKLRERAVAAIDTTLPAMMCQQTEVAKCLASDLKDVRIHSTYTKFISLQC